MHIEKNIRRAIHEILVEDATITNSPLSFNVGERVRFEPPPGQRASVMSSRKKPIRGTVAAVNVDGTISVEWDEGSYDESFDPKLLVRTKF